LRQPGDAPALQPIICALPQRLLGASSTFAEDSKTQEPGAERSFLSGTRQQIATILTRRAASAGVEASGAPTWRFSNASMAIKYPGSTRSFAYRTR
jgi:hypothetical protein